MSTLLDRVPCTIVTGFLGAGKTTLLRGLLEKLDGKRLAIIVNEFGDIGIDRRTGQWLHLLHGGG
jgi:cobalamin biosynthesis protein CobW